MHIAETSSTVVVDGLTGAQPKILSRVGKLPKSARDHSPGCTFLKPFYRLTVDRSSPKIWYAHWITQVKIRITQRPHETTAQAAFSF